jgi:hypothetical protein
MANVIVRGWGSLEVLSLSCEVGDLVHGLGP